jgi:hypothetical protein
LSRRLAVAQGAEHGIQGFRVSVDNEAWGVHRNPMRYEQSTL